MQLTKLTVGGLGANLKDGGSRTVGQLIKKRAGAPEPANDTDPQPKVRRNREQEMLTAATQIFAQKGYAATSVQDVADAVGVLKGSLYHYIDSKEDLLFTILHYAHAENEQLMADVRALDVEPVEKLRAYFERSMRTTLDNLDRTTLYFSDWKRLSGDRLETLIKQRRQYEHDLRDLIKDAHEALGITPESDVKYMSSFVIGATTWLADWYRGGDSRKADEVIRNYADLAMATIISGAHSKSLIESMAAKKSG